MKNTKRILSKSGHEIIPKINIFMVKANRKPGAVNTPSTPKIVLIYNIFGFVFDSCRVKTGANGFNQLYKQVSRFSLKFLNKIICTKQYVCHYVYRFSHVAIFHRMLFTMIPIYLCETIPNCVFF